jgi:hypothetical protein
MDDDYKFEKDYWGDCCNTFDEDQKHYVYARYMNLQRSHYSFLLENKSVLDIGGGPSSMLLKCRGLAKGLVIDPIEYPRWTKMRYLEKNINVEVKRGEDCNTRGWDEAWIYNCLQHTDDPILIIQNAKNAAKVVRIFEWINIPPHDGHPVQLTKDLLESCFMDITKIKSGTVTLQESGCYGEAYYGVFET